MDFGAVRFTQKLDRVTRIYRLPCCGEVGKPYQVFLARKYSTLLVELG